MEESLLPRGQFCIHFDSSSVFLAMAILLSLPREPCLLRVATFGRLETGLVPHGATNATHRGNWIGWRPRTRRRRFFAVPARSAVFVVVGSGVEKAAAGGISAWSFPRRRARQIGFRHRHHGDERRRRVVGMAWRDAPDGPRPAGRRQRLRHQPRKISETFPKQFRIPKQNP